LVERKRMHKWMRRLVKVIEADGYNNVKIEHLTKHYRCSGMKSGKTVAVIISGTPADEDTAIKQVYRDLRRQIKKITGTLDTGL
jgi:hypothetical protein